MVTESYRVTDPKTLRALSHPLRQRIIFELTVRRSARAADLAEILSEPANAVSYHLRALAKADLIVEAPELARDSRDRVWKAKHPEGIYVSAADSSTAGDVLDREYLSWIQALISETLPRDEQAARARYMGGALLTKKEATDMFMEVAEVLERWRAHGMDAAAADPHDPERVFHYTGAFVGNREVPLKGSGASDSAEEVTPTSEVS